MEPTFAIRWFYKHLAGAEVDPGLHTCAVCGLPTAVGKTPSKVLRKTFTDYQALRRPESAKICSACEWYFGQQDLRRSGWVLGANYYQQLKKADWFAVLTRNILTPPKEPLYYLIKPSGLVGKHLALYAPLNYGSSPLRVRYDTSTLDLDAAWLNACNAAFELRNHYSWKEIQADTYVRFWEDVMRFAQLRELISPYLYTPYMKLIEFVWTKGVSE